MHAPVFLRWLWSSAMHQLGDCLIHLAVVLIFGWGGLWHLAEMPLLAALFFLGAALFWGRRILRAWAKYQRTAHVVRSALVGRQATFLVVDEASGGRNTQVETGRLVNSQEIRIRAEAPVRVPPKPPPPSPTPARPPAPKPRPSPPPAMASGQELAPVPWEDDPRRVASFPSNASEETRGDFLRAVERLCGGAPLLHLESRDLEVRSPACEPRPSHEPTHSGQVECDVSMSTTSDSGEDGGCGGGVE